MTRRVALALLLSLLLAAWTPQRSAAFSCDGSCSGHGACDLTTGRCSCFPGYVGATCKSLACPRDVAWVDYPTATDTAHALAECSNMGVCDRTTGTCKCVTGFEGIACQRMSCPPCVNGRCVSLREAGLLMDGTNFVVPSTSYNVWDADKIFGCQCDIGFTGWDCSLRSCPQGDDPLTTTTTQHEIQHLNCNCNGACSGTFALTFRRRTTRNLLPTETAASLKAALEALDSVTQVSVSIADSLAAPLAANLRTVCDADGVTTSITFTNDPGNVPDLQLQNSLNAGAQLSLSSSGAAGVYDGVGASADGTRENADCSNRGICDFTTGVCTCTTNFGSSDGSLNGATGSPGRRGDCGAATATVSACPVTSNGPCDAKGTCSGAPTWTCTCNIGYTGADCSLRTCPTGAAWFDEPSATDTAHALAECSNKGKCDRKTGLCTCQAPFTGAACDVLSCPTGSGGQVCSGHGVCRTMAQLALAATNADGDALVGVTYGATANKPSTWDATKIQGCDCATGYSYMGAYSSAFGEFRDFDCGSRFCPVGADPFEVGKVNEIQSLSCQASSGTFTLTFRRQTTTPIAFDATAATLTTALQALSSLTTVLVTIGGGGTTVCDPAAAIVTTIEFTYEQGDVPMITTNAAQLVLAAGTPTLAVAETRKGTKANIECSSRGVCDRSTGVCACYNYFLSSDGAGGVGTRGDCGYISSYPTLAIA